MSSGIINCGNDKDHNTFNAFDGELKQAWATKSVADIVVSKLSDAKSLKHNCVVSLQKSKCMF